MTTKYELYRSAETPVPDLTGTWNMYGAGIENFGRDGKPEQFPVPDPGPNQMLIRVDSVGMCFSDVKLITQGGSHPKLYNRPLAEDPTRLGHEASVTIIKVGEELADQYYPGQRVAIQPDIYQDGKSTAYGYTVPGGLLQDHLIGPEVLVTDAGACLLPLEGDMGYAEASLLEPWGCVIGAYRQRRRLDPKVGGAMWIIGRAGDANDYSFSVGLEAPATIVLFDVPASVEKLAAQTSATIINRNGLKSDAYDELVNTFSVDAVSFSYLRLLLPLTGSAAFNAAPPDTPASARPIPVFLINSLLLLMSFG